MRRPFVASILFPQERVGMSNGYIRYGFLLNTLFSTVPLGGVGPVVHQQSHSVIGHSKAAFRDEKLN